MKMLILPTPAGKITRYFVQKFKYRNNEPCSFYRIIDSQTGKTAGQMKAYPEVVRDSYYTFSPNATEYRSFFIDRLFVEKEYRRMGIGTMLINIAKKESIRSLCSGNIHLISKNLASVCDVPHKFYRKLGFQCNKYSKTIQDYLDRCIKEDKQPDIKKTGISLPMFIEKCVIGQDKDIEKTYQLMIKFPGLFSNL